MKTLTLEWIEKAEEDYAAAQWLQGALMPMHDTVCFHSQQCIEKYLKAWLQEADTCFPRTHELEELLDLIVHAMPAWNSWRSDFRELTAHAVEFRYPGKSATANDAQYAMQFCGNVRHEIRRSLGISN